MATERKVVEIFIDSSKAARQLRSIDGNLNKTRKAAQGLQSSFARLNRVAGLLVGGSVFVRGLQNLTRMVDSYRELQGRVNLVARDTVGVTKAMDDLTEVALLTYTSLDAVAVGYTRLGNATKAMGVSHQDLIKLNTALADTMRISGSTAKEASAFMIQFAQGLGSGAIQGDEWRTVSETNIRLLQVLQKEFGKTSAELRKMSKEGLITADKVLPAILKNQQLLRREAEQMPLTVSRSWTNLRTVWQRLLADMERGVGVFGLVAEAVSGLAYTFREVNKGINSMMAQANANELAEYTKKLTDNALERIKIERKLAAAEEKTWWTVKSKERSLAGLREERLQNQVELLRIRKELNRVYKESPEYRKSREGLGLNPPPPPTSTPPKASKMIPGVDNLYPQSKAELAADAVNKLTVSINNQKLAAELLVPQLEALDNMYFDGKISAELYEREVEKLIPTTESLTATQEKVVEKSNQMAVALGQTLANATGTAADAIIDFAVRGESSFTDMANSILESIAKMIIQMMLMRSLFGSGVGTGEGIVGGWLPVTAGAKGLAFAGGGVMPLAKGGILNGPSIKPMASGGVALAGEAGPEAVMPLTRDRKGRLGVSGGNVEINVINNTPARVETSSSTTPDGREIINMVIAEVNKNITGGGSTSKAITQRFGSRGVGVQR